MRGRGEYVSDGEGYKALGTVAWRDVATCLHLLQRPRAPALPCLLNTLPHPAPPLPLYRCRCTCCAS